MGFQGQVARQQTWAANVCFGSISDIPVLRRDVRFALNTAMTSRRRYVRSVPKADIHEAADISGYSWFCGSLADCGERHRHQPRVF